jgi:hypothetical protein
MSWEQFHRRQRAIHAALEYGREHPTDSLEPHVIPDARSVFASSDELLATLQYKWTQALAGRLEVASITRDDPDPLDTVATAWRETAADNTVLRDVLNRCAPAPGSTFAAAQDRENRLLALLSGMAGPSEPDHEITRIGAAVRESLQIPEPRRAEQRRATADVG